MVVSCLRIVHLSSGDYKMSGKPVPRPNPDSVVFWEACNDERFMIQKCNTCGKSQFYPRAICKSCHSTSLEWQTASGRGKIKTFTVVHHAPSPAFKEDLPYVLALIDLEEGVRTMMNVIDCDPADAHIGMEVEITFEMRGDNEQKIPQAKAIGKTK
ncbi:MAG: Zn-ribbon domain-containing OB-fold protein, partial [Alphaproteobacteria bacterium]